MRNPAAAKLAARKILGRAWRGRPALTDRYAWDGPPGKFPSGAEIIARARGVTASHPGPKTGAHAFRDLYLAMAVYHLHESFGVKPTSRMKEGSGCAIVAEVATEIGISDITYQTVRKVWESYKHLR